MSLDVPHANPTTHLISSYIYRKALIRKHQLHLTITEYLAKCEHRGVDSILRPLPLPYATVDGGAVGQNGEAGGSAAAYENRGGVPRGWVVDVQFADELDELLMDDLYELAEGMRRNEELSDGEKQYVHRPLSLLSLSSHGREGSRIRHTQTRCAAPRTGALHRTAIPSGS